MMEKFELRTDKGLTLIKATRFLGTIFFGFFIGATFMIYRIDGSVEWMTALPGIVCSLALALFPGGRVKECLKLDGEGITFFNYQLYGGKEKKIEWEKVKAIGVNKNVIEIKNSIGSSEKIRLPFTTNKKREQFKHYLKQLTDSKGLEYLQ
ncbi:MAG: hypothetical protein LAT80_07110 [Balneolaceae bacterium]|nr:hypothetical protein [Balneolaceae bacterium]